MRSRTISYSRAQRHTKRSLLFLQQWALVHNGIFVVEFFRPAHSTTHADIKAYMAGDITFGSTDVIVAIADTGVDFTHPDLARNIYTNPGEIAGNGIDDDKNGYVDDVHGYNVAEQERRHYRRGGSWHPDGRHHLSRDFRTDIRLDPRG